MSYWDKRDHDEVWRRYTEALEELAGSGVVDVLAHPDLVKVAGRFPSLACREECEERIAEAASRSGLAAELSSAGLRKPAGEVYSPPSLLARFRARGVPLTTASDTHGLTNLAEHSGALAALARGAGYDQLQSFEGRQGIAVAIGAP
jgi:histidinol-phosphatase (PHP family)